MWGMQSGLQKFKMAGGLGRFALGAVGFAFMAGLADNAAAAAPVGDRGMDAKQTSERLQFENANAPDFKEKGGMFGRPKMKTPEEQFVFAEKREQDGSLRSATSAFNALISEWGTSNISQMAQLKVAELYEKRGRYLDSFKEYQYFVEYFSSAENTHFNDVIAKQFALANSQFSRLEGGFFSAPDPEVVADMFGKIISNAPDGEHAAESQFKRGACFENKGDWLDAALAYEKLAARYPDSPLRIDAFYRAALARAKLADKYPRDERIMKNAISGLRIAYRADPEHSSANEVFEAEKRLYDVLSKLNFEKAEFYDKIRKNPAAAIIAYNAFLSEFAGSAEAEKARNRMEQLETAERVKNEIQEEKYEQEQ